MQCNVDSVVARGFQRAVRQADLRFGNREALLGQFLSDVMIGNRTKQSTVNTGFLRQLDAGAMELFAVGL